MQEFFSQTLATRSFESFDSGMVCSLYPVPSLDLEQRARLRPALFGLSDCQTILPTELITPCQELDRHILRGCPTFSTRE
ncbi:MAG: hypothetical protein AMK69_08855 [Nitrospira bacterium SG8_3]|nr:MAG: hypothetical protein AMK69_08855 [Nitrospira bacterium SG8_3]